MLTIADAGQARLVTGGVDTHAEVHVAGMVDQAGRVLGTREFPADAAGYQAALAWMRGRGELVKVGVEGTGSYGAGLARYLAAEGVEVTEVIRPNRQARRRRGKSDAADAVAAALAALNGEASGTPKSGDGAVESIRALRVARRSAVKARTQAGNQLRDLIITAPEQVRDKLAGLATAQRAPWPPGSPRRPHRPGRRREGRDGRRGPPPPGADRRDHPAGRLPGCARPARRPGRVPGKEGRRHSGREHPAHHGRRQPGPAADRGELAALCGASPVDASSGKQRRHRLNRGGDRQANSALWRIVFTRMACDPRTQAYVARRTTEGKTTKEIMRCLKRYVAREIYKALVTQARNPAAGIPLTPAA